MFTNPKDYGRKAEDLLWRKVYYDVIQWLRQRRKVLNDYDSKSIISRPFWLNLLSHDQMETNWVL